MIDLAGVKLALRIVTDDFDPEIKSLMAAARGDLNIAGVNIPDDASMIDLINLAIVTYVKCHFGNPDNYDRLKKSYDEQKAQLSMASGFTNWSVGCNG